MFATIRTDTITVYFGHENQDALHCKAKNNSPVCKCLQGEWDACGDFPVLLSLWPAWHCTKIKKNYTTLMLVPLVLKLHNNAHAGDNQFNMSTIM